ncbi:MAG: NAD(P)H-binding protein [Myxococcaceae bacterium]|nr:NAD(P)H-binding protein [Myxococcaceae bacterium]
MNVVVLGASGGCGRQLVQLGAERGHRVTAVTRSTSKVDVPPGVTIDRGELTSVEFLQGVLHGQDAVLSGLGLKLPGLAPWNKPEDATFLSRSTAALVEACKAEGVRKVIAISAGGVGDSLSKVPGVFRFMIKTTALKVAYAQLDDMEQQLLRSGLDVCLPRPTGLTDGPLTKQAVVAGSFKGRATISRADVAWWMLDQLDAPSFAERTPMITVTGAS